MAKKKYRVVSIKADWYKNPKMAGHTWARNTHRLATQELKPFAKTKIQKQLMNTAISFSSTNWNYWCSWVSKKDISQIKHCLKAIAKGQTWGEMYRWVSHRHGMVTSNFLRFLEVKFYDEDRMEYLQNACSYTMSLGMPQNDAIERAENRIQSYREKLNL